MKKMIVYIVSIAVMLSALPMTVFATENTEDPAPILEEAINADKRRYAVTVKIPIGETFLGTGELSVEYTTPSYISEEGYPMLPVKAVALAFEIRSNNITWDAEVRTITMLYGQETIVIPIDEKAVYIDGTRKETSAAAAIVDGRTFLSLRDVALAFGVSDENITWDEENQVAALTYFYY